MTAAGAAIADGVEAVQDGILEPGRVHVPSLVFCLEKLQRLCLSESAAALWVVLQDEIHTSRSPSPKNGRQIAQ
jgi:hypothetical protein